MKRKSMKRKSMKHNNTMGGWWSSHSDNPHNMGMTHKMEKAAKNRFNAEKRHPGKNAAWLLNSGQKAKLSGSQSVGRPPKSKLNAAAKSVKSKKSK